MQTVDQRIIKALGHPLRQRILAVLDDHEASPNDIARELDEPLGTVAYHVRILRDHDCVELTRQVQVRGAVQSFYRATVRPFLDDEHWAQLPIGTRRELFSQTLGDITTAVHEASARGGFDDVQTHVSLTPLAMDARGWQEVTDLLASTLLRVLELQAEATERLDGEGGEVESSLAILHFRGSDA